MYQQKYSVIGKRIMFFAVAGWVLMVILISIGIKIYDYNGFLDMVSYALFKSLKNYLLFVIVFFSGLLIWIISKVKKN